MQLVDYANRVQAEVTQALPDQMTGGWGGMWNTTLSALYNPQGAVTAVYEHASLIVARWEFLGGLFRGTSGRTDVKDARAYADRFLPASYGPVHNLSGERQPTESEFFSIFRNKSLHGFTPSGVYRFPAAGGDVCGWSVGPQPAGTHLQLSAGLAIQIDSATLQAEFVQSVADFAVYLAANADPTFALTPHQRWRRGFWARFCPVNYDGALWEQEGRARGLYP